MFVIMGKCFKVGDRVMIKSRSRYYFSGFDNPVDTIGKITYLDSDVDIHDRDNLYISVHWESRYEDGRLITNVYHDTDLVPYNKLVRLGVLKKLEIL